MDRPGPPSILRQLSAVPFLIHIQLLKVYWSIIDLFPSWRKHPKWSLSRSVGFRGIARLLSFLARNQDLGTRDINTVPNLKELKKRNTVFAWIPEWGGQVAGYIGKLAAERGVKSVQLPGYWYGDTDGFDPAVFKASADERVLLYFHGGAYILFSAHPTDPSDMFAFIPQNVPKQSKTIQRALSVEYRLSSSPPFKTANAFPTALVDAISSFHYLLSLGYTSENIYVSGDSAGGNLALALARYVVVEEDRTLGGLILFSPWVDLTNSHDGPTSSKALYRNVDILGTTVDADSYALRSFLAGTSAEDVYISPACKRLEPSFKNFPRTYVTWGEVETLKDEDLTLCSRMEGSVLGGLTRDEVANSPHDTCLYTLTDHERHALVERVGKWVDAA